MSYQQSIEYSKLTVTIVAYRALTITIYTTVLPLCCLLREHTLAKMIVWLTFIFIVEAQNVRGSRDLKRKRGPKREKRTKTNACEEGGDRTHALSTKGGISVFVTVENERRSKAYTAVKYSLGFNNKPKHSAITTRPPPLNTISSTYFGQTMLFKRNG